jgi:hypothetical protein
MATAANDTLVPFWLTPGEAGETDGLLLWANGRSPLHDEPFELLPLFCKTPSCSCGQVTLTVFDRQTLRSIATLKVHCEAECLDEGVPHVSAASSPGGDTAICVVVLKILEEEPEYLRSLERSYHLIRAALRSPAGRCDSI